MLQDLFTSSWYFINNTPNNHFSRQIFKLGSFFFTHLFYERRKQQKMFIPIAVNGRVKLSFNISFVFSQIYEFEWKFCNKMKKITSPHNFKLTKIIYANGNFSLKYLQKICNEMSIWLCRRTRWIQWQRRMRCNRRKIFRRAETCRFYKLFGN